MPDDEEIPTNFSEDSLHAVSGSNEPGMLTRLAAIALFFRNCLLFIILIVIIGSKARNPIRENIFLFNNQEGK